MILYADIIWNETCMVIISRAEAFLSRQSLDVKCKRPRIIFFRDTQTIWNDKNNCLNKVKPFLIFSLRSTSFVQFTDDFNCTRMIIRNCSDAGYNFTSVSRAYQQRVQSAGIFTGINSSLKKVLCMELAPPCNNNNSRTLYVPCQSTCKAAFNESKSQFLGFFKSPDYCSTFPDENPQSGKEYCALKTWPSSGYWPSGLWKRFSSSRGMFR